MLNNGLKYAESGPYGQIPVTHSGRFGLVVLRIGGDDSRMYNGKFS